jgi:hypothetical protein
LGGTTKIGHGGGGEVGGDGGFGGAGSGGTGGPSFAVVFHCTPVTQSGTTLLTAGKGGGAGAGGKLDNTSAPAGTVGFSGETHEQQ